MSLPSSSAQAARQALGDRLRELRQDAGLTGRSLAMLAGWDRTKVSKIEHGRTTPTASDIRTWCQHTDTRGQIPDLIASLQAVEGMFIEWRRLERAGLRRAQESVAPLFARTKRFRAYDSWLVPGLLQTAAYTKAVLTATARRRGLADDVDQAVAVRMERQRVLARGDHTFAVVIEASVLYNGIGSVQTMTEQLRHLQAVSKLASVSLGVIPFQPGRVLRAVEGFWVFDDERVTVELVSGWLTLTQPKDIEMYAQAFETLSTMAVYGAEARAVITEAIQTLAKRPGGEPSE